jgi:putative ABC transport system permease protein
MAWRETRAGWREFLGFLVCVALGVAALTSVGTFGRNLDRALAREAKTLLGGDVEVRSTRPIEAPVDADLDRLARHGAGISRVVELVAMARAPGSGRTLLVELKAADQAYPLYGTLGTSPGGPLARLVADGGAIVGPDLLERLGARVGDRLTIGSADLTIRGVVQREPDRPATLLSLGPRVFLSPASLDRSGLIRPGSRTRHRVLLRLPGSESPGAVRAGLAASASDPAVRVVTFDESRPGLRRSLSQATTYLGLVGLVSFLVGGVGVAASVTTFLRRRLTTIAVLKCLGAGSSALVTTYLAQTLALGVAGSMAGGLTGLAVQPLLVRLVHSVLPLVVEARPDGPTLVRAVAMGTLTALFAARWPLLLIREVSPSVLLRHRVEPGLTGATGARRGRPGPPHAPRSWRAWVAPRCPPLVYPAAIAAALGSLVGWQAGSVTLAALFLGGALATLGVLGGLGRALTLVPRLSRWTRGLAWRHGIANLGRPGGQTTAVVVALGVGAMLLVAVALLEGSLTSELERAGREAAPSFFFIDVQPDQRAALASIVGPASGGLAPVFTPIVRSRLAAIDGAPITRQTIERRRGRDAGATWYFTRDYLLTFADALPATNSIVRGRWWGAVEAARRPWVSVEDDAAKALGVDIGDRLTFDVQGVPIEAVVMNLRKVDWESLSTNFFVIFSPGALDGAPTTYVATARVPAAAETALQDAVVTALPNVTAIPVRDVLQRLAGLLAQLALAIRVVTLFSIASGVAVMLGVLTASRYQRLYESVILRTLGATRAAVARTFAVEYGCLGAAAGVGGALSATVLAWVVLRFGLGLPWRFAPAALVGGVAATVAVAIAVGFLGTFRLLGMRPLAVLRRE